MSGKLLFRCVCTLDSLALPSRILATLVRMLVRWSSTICHHTHFRGPYREDLDIHTVKYNHVCTHTHFLSLSNIHTWKNVTSGHRREGWKGVNEGLSSRRKDMSHPGLR